MHVMDQTTAMYTTHKLNLDQRINRSCRPTVGRKSDHTVKMRLRIKPSLVSFSDALIYLWALTNELYGRRDWRPE